MGFVPRTFEKTAQKYFRGVFLFASAGRMLSFSLPCVSATSNGGCLRCRPLIFFVRRLFAFALSKSQRPFCIPRCSPQSLPWPVFCRLFLYYQQLATKLSIFKAAYLPIRAHRPQLPECCTHPYWYRSRTLQSVLDEFIPRKKFCTHYGQRWSLKCKTLADVH